MSSSTDQPSIFTAREAFTKPPLQAQGSGRAPSYRRQSTPDHLERSRVQASGEAESFATAAPDSVLPSVLYATSTSSKATVAPPPAWPSRAPSEQQRASGREQGRGKGRSVSASEAQSATNPPPASPPSEKTTKKRPASPLVRSPHGERPPTSEPASKRPRLKARSKHFLDSFNFGSIGFHDGAQQPPSPLFFSNSPQPNRPTLPPRFSSSEAAAKMLSKTRTEDSHVKTVSLARGVLSTPQIPTSNPQYAYQSPGSRRSMESVPTRSRSPESSFGSSGSKDLGSILNSIGIIELLEQDERPTFIVDLGDKLNYGPGQLNLIFCNASLRSSNGLEAQVSGAALESTSPGTQTHLQFKSWLMSAAVNGESLDVCLPSFLYAGLSWNCATIRKRLRIISGAFQPSPEHSRAPELRSSIPPAASAEMPLLQDAVLAEAPAEPSDYFGMAAPQGKNSSDGSGSTSTVEAVATIEQGPPSAGAQLERLQNLRGSVDVNKLLSPERDLSEAIQLLKSPSTYVNEPPAKPNPYSEAVRAQALMADDSNSHIMTVASDSPSFDWTRLPISDSMPEHIRFARSIDWASTSLGPIENWSSDLRQMCNLIMASPHPAAMYWGEDLIAIYNEAYILLAGQKHPGLMGRSYAEAWSEIWNDVKDVFASAKITGEATMKDDDCLFIDRNEYLEETYFSWSIIPMVGADGSVMGLYNPAFEKTRRKIAERRMLTLREVGERTASARDVKGFWAQVLGSFEFNDFDSPFLLLYSVADESDSDTSSIHSNSILTIRNCQLEGKLGIPDDHPAAPENIDLKAGTEGFGPVFREVMKTDKPVLLEVGSRDLPQSLLSGLQLRGFGDPVKAVVVCPIHPTTGENILGFLVLGVNPRRPYDDDYALFVQLLSRQLATSLASVVLFEEEIRRGQKAAKLAALDRIELSEQLAARTQEAIESETKFTRMAEFAPVGMFIANASGKITFANDTWYDISRVPKNSSMADTWMDSVNPEDQALVKGLWNDLVVGTKAVSHEFRFRAQWEDRNGNRGDTWVLFSGYPEKHADGRLKSIFGSITNISQQKWAEGIQTRKMEEAVELKRQQENFIDITSHEMRNPLSAILQCSDEIISSLTEFKNNGDKDLPDSLLSSCLDAAQIINLCSQHQKRIVDDILTLSKLDSALLLVTPVDAQPLTVVQRALKMHEGELQAADIQMKFLVDQSYRDLGLDWVRLDPSRVLQVLINLTTNAIKFTGTERKRTITVTIAACLERPSEMKDAPVQYFSTRRKNGAQIDDKDWGDGQKVYIHFAVRDTGRGLNAEEKKMLFMRFSQASPRTHVQYGGSGLGLFISRELTELQGGEIGVESEAGKGSTFAFYIVARKSTAPAEADAITGMKYSAHKNRSAVAQAAKKATESLASTAKPSPNGTVPSSSTSPLEPIKHRVLIVEDNLVNQRVLQKQLKNLGTEVHLANHGGEALEKLRQSSYWTGNAGKPGTLELGVVLMDQEMPVMDGLTCTRKIRELEQEGKLVGHVPIIAVTANARAEQVKTALEAGMDDVVSKPFRIPELVPKIEELMGRYPAPSA
ncbi:uncharacterized protein LTR77_004284 [Saxophila tyrrhenica]|uniref:Uncharacterized protein n=1 Tax=Saxophila tyrrhenica TaxID=1690608 RepID=A0AAV9PGL9_9PEZI|nr:hypothetical protein LTR77_004284 [Saxophila tyrrhenica]